MRFMVMLALVGCTASANAQEVASSMEQLRVLARPGEQIEVTSVGGEKTKARIESISSAGVDVWVRGALLRIPDDQIAVICARQQPNVAKGARTGFVVGAVFGILP